MAHTSLLLQLTYFREVCNRSLTDEQQNYAKYNENLLKSSIFTQKLFTSVVSRQSVELQRNEYQDISCTFLSCSDHISYTEFRAPMPHCHQQINSLQRIQFSQFDRQIHDLRKIDQMTATLLQKLRQKKGRKRLFCSG